jgi:protocatechuate 3,4-dioxygenase beta subunit
MQISLYALIPLLAIASATTNSCNQSEGNSAVKNAGDVQNDEPPSCDCCVFGEVQNQQLSHQTQIAPDTVAGERIKVLGVVYQPDGKTPAVNIKMYFYHTNNYGKYGKLGTEVKTSHAWWHGYCRSWLKTNAKGEYEINTIKPKAYPNGNEPAHIHASVLNADETCSHLVDFVFKGDPFLTKGYWNNVRSFWKRIGKEGDPEYEGVAFTKDTNGVMEGRRNIVLSK